MSHSVRIVACSDTHNRHNEVVVPPGDVFVHTGDFCGRGTLDEVRLFGAWLAELPHRHKIVIAGNHDWPFQHSPREARALLGDCIYLQDEAHEAAGLRFYGSPWQPVFFNWAFNLPRGPELAAKWARIPEDTEVLLTHGPPQGIGDRTADGENAGCDDLRRRIARVQPKVHIFGHIHEAYGRRSQGGITYVNACTCDLSYRAVNPAVVVDVQI